MITAVFLKKNCSYSNSCRIQLHDADLEHSLIKDKNYVYMFFFLFYMVWYSRFSFRNLKDANYFMF